MHHTTYRVVNLVPLPCWGIFRRSSIASGSRSWSKRSSPRPPLAEPKRESSPSVGPPILRQHPFSQPAKTKKSPAPLVHAASKRIRTEVKIAYAWFARAFREAAENLRAGDRLVRFPRGCFPPGLPSVRSGRSAIGPDLGPGRPDLGLSRPNLSLSHRDLSLSHRDLSLSHPDLSPGRPDLSPGHRDLDLCPSDPGLGRPDRV